MEVLLSAIMHYATHYKLEPKLVQAVIKQESNFNQYAIGPIGEVGYMQVRPEYSKEANLFDTRVNVKEGVRLLAEARKKCTHKQDYTFLVCYNAGLTGGSRIKNPKDTNYYKKVMRAYDELKRGTNSNNQKIARNGSRRRG